jgi:hypothetical protein
MTLDITEAIKIFIFPLSLNKISTNFWEMALKTEADLASENFWVFQPETTESVQNFSYD